MQTALKTAVAAALFSVAAGLAAPAMAAQGNGFSLTIRGASEGHNGYVRLRQGQTYAICFRNDRNRRADVVLKIDGLDMGTWRMNAYQSACVERPQNDRGQFTFYRADSNEGYAVGSAQTHVLDKGVISATFYPERVQPPVYSPPVQVPGPYGPYAQARPQMQMQMQQAQPQTRMQARPEMQRRAAPQAYGAAPNNSYAAPQAQAHSYQADPGLGAGVTGLTGQSGQTFGTAGQIDRDYAAATTLELRLIHDPAMDYPRPGPRPLPGRGSVYAPAPIW